MLTRTQKVIVWAIDLGFIAYWLLISLRVLPAEAMFAGYEKPEVQAWNWSFLPLDILASLTGILGNTTNRLDKKTLLTISLVLTSVAGGMAVGYWAFIGDFELSWWLPNLVLLLFPIWPLTNFTRQSK
ncbi:MAG: hypothetical protein RI933_741 [Actinomycetota bacterium]|jgi:hypothetical protein